MPLSSSTVRELQRELKQLKQMRGDLNARINAIHALVSVKKTLPLTDEAGSAIRTSVRPQNTASSAKGTRRVQKRPFRAVVLATIKATPGLMPRQVTDVLKKSGFSDRKPRLGTRVYKSMYKMTKQGVLKKAAGGGYIVAPARTTAVSSRMGQDAAGALSADKVNSTA